MSQVDGVDRQAAVTVPEPGNGPGVPVNGVLARVRAQLPEFTGALQRVAEQVLIDPSAAARATIVELAERSGTSPATVTRFCRALGFEGSQLVVLDLLYIAVAQRTHDRAHASFQRTARAVDGHRAAADLHHHR